MFPTFVSTEDDDGLVGTSYEQVTDHGDRIMLRVVLRLKFAGPDIFVAFKRTICGNDERQAQYPDTYLVLTSAQIHSGDLDFVVTVRHD